MECTNGKDCECGDVLCPSRVLKVYKQRVIDLDVEIKELMGRRDMYQRSVEGIEHNFAKIAAAVKTASDTLDQVRGKGDEEC